ncbi:MAG: hypothetical protein K6C08_10695 [Oscillospiraceae bacterium]|nr:hypothetical protein [Oscillospiraceae bacterium]
MENQELFRRAEDLCRRSAGKWQITHTSFLTPAECLQLQRSFRPEDGVSMHFFGGHDDAERRVLFFLPDGVEQSEIRTALCAVHYQAWFGEPGHRDYLGSLLASGISRDRLGDILISGTEAWVFCLPGVLGHLLSIDRIGRISVKAEEADFSLLPPPAQEMKTVSFTVQSMRLDAVAAGMFRLSRSACAERIREGMLSLNYQVCLKIDAPVKEGDVISLRGYGKGSIAGLGGSSRKGRQFVNAEIRL